jgi:queuine tRNA-ribosyltransferase
MPDATRAAVRGVTPDEIKKSGITALVVNTYHLMLQPGEALIKKATVPARHTSPACSSYASSVAGGRSDSGGGIHVFMGWDGPVLSDSGGYQVYSLIHRNPEMGRITEEGAEFKSVLDGSKHLLTPERAIQIQFDLGVDMMVCLDDPRPNSASEIEVAEAVERTLRWAARCKAEYDRQVAERGLTDEIKPLLFGVVQGGMFVGLREHCAQGLAEIGFDGYGFGGRHIDEEGVFLEEIVAKTAAAIPEDALRFALGIGTPSDIVRCYQLGWDMFDCVIPTREGRHGRLFVWKNGISNLESRISAENQDSKIKIQDSLESFYETINILNEQYKEDFTAVDETCDCELCMKYTRSYLKHLFKVADPLAGRLATLHNLRFYARLMEHLRS